MTEEHRNSLQVTTLGVLFSHEGFNFVVGDVSS